MNTCDLIVEITQSVIAVLIVVGGGYALVFVPTLSQGMAAAVVGAAGVVIGFYFQKTSSSGSLVVPFNPPPGVGKTDSPKQTTLPGEKPGG